MTIKCVPVDNQALFKQAAVLNQQGRLGEAEALYRQVVAQSPNHFDALHLLGAILLQTNRVLQGLEVLQRALTIDPNNADLHNNIGNGLGAAERYVEAVAAYGRAIELNPNFAEAYQNRAKILDALRDFPAALLDYDRVVALRPDWLDPYYNRGNVYAKMRRFDDALADYDKALGLKPDCVEAHLNRGNALRELGRVDEAVLCYDRVIALRPDHADAHFNKSQCLLLLGRLDEGWPFYEWRKKRAEPIAARDYVQPLWMGTENIAGKTLFVYCEQGLGDTIQFCRYLPLLQARGARVICAAPRGLHHLLKSLNLAPELIDENSVPAMFDFHIPLMSLPLAFGTNLENIPAAARYLSAAPSLVKKWRKSIGDAGFKVGIAWKGKDNPVLYGRSFPVTMLAGLTGIPDIRLISLQKGEGVEQLQYIPPDMKIETLGVDFDVGANAFQDTAAVIENLDLVITLDSAIAHLAGALERPTWVALKQVPDWRWLLAGDKCLWYPSMRLFRQKGHDDWHSVFEEMKKELRK